MLKNEIQILGKERDNLKIILDKLDLIKDEGIKKLDEKYKKLNEERNKILDDLMSKTNNNTFKSCINNNELINGEKLTAINFTSDDKSINHTIICKNTAKFYEVEKELYSKYPEFEEENNSLNFNGLKIDRWKTLEENNIIGCTIMLNKIDNK